ncbi:MAG TPA: thiolase family protein [Planctomycetes bacterium]|nr:thiolase family protein [Planctomycetota bacterium]
MSQPNPGPREVVVTHALRTPIGKFLGGLASLSSADLGVSVVTDLLARSGIDPARVGEFIFGNGRQAGGGPNVARQISIRSGIPDTTPAYTVNMACASGLKSITLAADTIRAGRADVAVAGGTESMSGLPYLLRKMRTGYRLGHDRVVDAMYQDGFLCPISEMLMGATAEKLAVEFDITREEQDRYALESQQRAAAAQAEGRFDDEISPVTVHGRKGDTIVDRDEHLRPNTTMEKLAKLPGVFAEKDGTVTPGNASGITDGAAALLLMARETAEELGLEPMATVGEFAQVGLDASRMGLGPVPACRELQERNGLVVDAYDLIELNEAFAAQVLACRRELPFPMERVNVNGGAIALGHPIGATGARIAVTLLHEFKRRGGENALATLCVSGGLGFATAFHRAQQ